MQPLRTALVGCGKVGQIHARALAALAESEFVAVCDVDFQRAEAFAGRFGVRPYNDVRRMLDESAVGALSIATPHPLHAEAALRAAQAGVHVLVEKPMAASLEDCDAMIAAADRYKIKLGVVSQRRWYEPVRRMKDAIAGGKIGRPVLGAVTMYSWREPAYYESDPWRGRWDSEGGGVLVNQSPHMLDLLQWLMDDEVVEISGRIANFNHPTVEVEDSALAIVRFRGGGLGSIIVSLAQKPGIYTKVHIHGNSGASLGVETDRGATFIAGITEISEPPLLDLWTIPGEEHLLARFQAEDRDCFQEVDALHHYHALQIQDFLQAALDDRPPLVTGHDGRRVVAIFRAIYESDRTGKVVTLPAASGSAGSVSAADGACRSDARRPSTRET
jgi:UDP-N-acetyl-2-amino-2-deoxyglucuronate dehydrogenase